MTASPPFHMVRPLLFALAAWTAVLSAASLRRIAQVPSGPQAGDVPLICYDSDHDSLPEIIFDTYFTVLAGNKAIEFWEHQGWNRFSLVYADTGEYPYPPGITTGNAIPYAAGDIDGDGLTDIVCVTTEPDSTDPRLEYDDVITIESPDSFSYPSRLSWHYRCCNNFTIPFPTYYPPDLDKDGHREIMSFTPDTIVATGIWENVGDDSNDLVWHDMTYGYSFAFGDFDLDGRMDFASSSLGSGQVMVWECTGDDQYDMVYEDTVNQSNGVDVFMTNDIDGDGLPEFYVAYENVPRGRIYLYMWEADHVGTDTYHRTLVDSVAFSGTDWGRISECGDVDTDGIDECIWTTPDVIKVYKAVGDDQLQEVWHWDNDHGGFRSLVSTVYDINNDGYNELITAGNAKISIFEVDAVDLLSPNSGSCSVGDTIAIRWAVNTPPRCDSLSLFLRRDSLWNLSTIATGLPPDDTLYWWLVPVGVPETARVVAIAYGPGWQFDMSDSAITFIGGGVAEGIRSVPLQWSLSVSPNPARGAFTVRYDVPDPVSPRRGGGASSEARFLASLGMTRELSLGVYDAGGRLVRSLSEGDVAPGRYEARLPSGALPAGIYFLRLDTPGFRAVKKAVVAR